MGLFDGWRRKWRGARWSGDDLEEEMAFHVDMETERNVSRGMDPKTARMRALQAFGNPARTRESCRGAAGWAWLGDFASDVAYGLRLLRRRKGLAVAAILILALCLGANTAFFAALHSLALEDLPFREPDRLVEIARMERGIALGTNLSLYSEYKERDDLFESVAFFSGSWANIEIGGESFRGHALSVSDGFFETLGRHPVAGRFLDETSPDGSAWVAESLWENAFGADGGLIGSTVVVNGRSYRIAGVAPREAETVANQVSVFLKIDRERMLANPFDEAVRSENDGKTWARLTEAASPQIVEGALAEAETRFQERASEAYREVNDKRVRQYRVRSVKEVKTEWAKKRLVLLNAGALIVLIVGCVNVVNLLLAQANGRGEEFWTRRMLGADTCRIVRQCVAEVVGIIGVGFGLSVLVSLYGTIFLGAYSQDLFRTESGISLGWPVWTYATGVALAAALFMGLVIGGKAVAASRSFDNSRSGVQSTPSGGTVWARSGLAVVQAAFTVVLLVCGGLLVKSFYNVTHQDYGFDEEGVVTGRIHLPDATYEDDSMREAYKERLLQSLLSHPDVQSASLSTVIPTFGYPERMVLKRDAASGEAKRRCYVGSVSARHFDTMGIALLGGRGFSEVDAFGWQTPVVVDERFAELFYPGQDVIGKRIALGRRPRNERNWPVIVGVVEQTRNTGLDVEEGMPVVFLPLKGNWANEFSVFVKSRRDAASAMRILTEAATEIDPSLPIYRSGSLESVIGESLVGRKGLLALCASMALVALVLSAVGVYGASAFRVSQRLREFAIRMAVGATERQVIGSHVALDLRHAAWGLAIGLLTSWFAGRFLRLWLYRVDPFDAGMYFGLAALVVAVYLISSYLPSRKGVSENRVRL